MEPMILATVHKNGSSLAVVLPKDICRALDIKRGDQLMVSAEKGVVQYHIATLGAALQKIIKA